MYECFGGVSGGGGINHTGIYLYFKKGPPTMDSKVVNAAVKLI